MSLRKSLLRVVDNVRAIPGKPSIDIRQYRVVMRVSTWKPTASDTTDIQLGRGRMSYVDTPITVAGGANPKVRRLAHKETLAGGGKYQEGDFRIGPLTPDYPGGGIAFSDMVPVGTGDARTHYHILLWGPDLPARGMLCSPVAEEGDKNFSRFWVVRPEGAVPAE